MTLPNYCTSSDLIAYGFLKTSDDAQLTRACALASRVIDNYCGGPFTLVGDDDVVKQIFGQELPIIYPPQPCSAITSITMNSDYGESIPIESWSSFTDNFGNITEVLAPTTFSSYPTYFAARHRNFWISVTGRFGFASTPEPVNHAAVRLAARYVNETPTALPLPIDVTKIVVEGYEVDAAAFNDKTLDSTGDREADLLLEPYRDNETVVA